MVRVRLPAGLRSFPYDTAGQRWPGRAPFPVAFLGAHPWIHSGRSPAVHALSVPASFSHHNRLLSGPLFASAGSSPDDRKSLVSSGHFPSRAVDRRRRADATPDGLGIQFFDLICRGTARWWESEGRKWRLPSREARVPRRTCWAINVRTRSHPSGRTGIEVGISGIR